MTPCWSRGDGSSGPHPAEQLLSPVTHIGLNDGGDGNRGEVRGKIMLFLKNLPFQVDGIAPYGEFHVSSKRGERWECISRSDSALGLGWA